MTSDDAGTKETVPIAAETAEQKKIELAAGNPEERENRHAAETAEQRSEGGGSGTVSGAVFKMPVKKFYSGKVPVTMGGWQTRPPRRGK